MGNCSTSKILFRETALHKIREFEFMQLTNILIGLEPYSRRRLITVSLEKDLVRFDRTELHIIQWHLFSLIGICYCVSSLRISNISSPPPSNDSFLTWNTLSNAGGISFNLYVSIALVAAGRSVSFKEIHKLIEIRVIRISTTSDVCLSRSKR